MVDRIEESVHDETPGLKNAETHVLTHSRSNYFFVLNFSDLKKAQICKMP